MKIQFKCFLIHSSQTFKPDTYYFLLMYLFIPHTHTHNIAQLHKQGVLGKSKEDHKKGGQKKCRDWKSDLQLLRQESIKNFRMLFPFAYHLTRQILAIK